MDFCAECGTKLMRKELENEGMVPYCQHCQVYRFPQYNVAVSAIIYDELEKRILLIQQYGNANNILVAGYVGRGESLEEALVREIKEETNLDVVEFQFNASHFYEKNNVLMVNFACRIKDATALSSNHEIDQANWFFPTQAKEVIYPNSLAQEFLNAWLDKQGLITNVED
ncbi:NUDIX domain-containing protein [Streptococcus suis]|nr:NUDIX domain-containing protein [Streptococcus suis]